MYAPFVRFALEMGTIMGLVGATFAYGWLKGREEEGTAVSQAIQQVYNHQYEQQQKMKLDHEIEIEALKRQYEAVVAEDDGAGVTEVNNSNNSNNQ